MDGWSDRGQMQHLGSVSCGDFVSSETPAGRDVSSSPHAAVEGQPGLQPWVAEITLPGGIIRPFLSEFPRPSPCLRRWKKKVSFSRSNTLISRVDRKTSLTFLVRQLREVVTQPRGTWCVSKAAAVPFFGGILIFVFFESRRVSRVQRPKKKKCPHWKKHKKTHTQKKPL